MKSIYTIIKNNFIILICGISIVIQLMYGEHFFDDAFITFRYARNIADGLGFVYNSGEKILGTTTPLFTLLLAGSGRLFSNSFIPHFSYIISLIADAVSIYIFFQIARIIFEDIRIANGLVIIFAFQPFRINISSGGMETSILILFLLLLYYVYFTKKSYLFISIISAILILIRPDSILALILLYSFWFLEDRRNSLKFGLFAILMVLPWIIWSTAYFGTPIPNSILAKGAAYAFMPAGHAAWFLLSFFATGSMGPFDNILLLASGFFLFLISMTLGFIEFYRNKRIILPLLLYPILYFLVFSLRNPAMYFPWYYPPLIPGILFAFGGAFVRITRQFRLSKVIWGFAFAFVLLITPTFFLHFFPTFPISRVRETQFQDACNIAKDSVTPGDEILTSDIGVIGWCFPKAKIIDPVGLVSPNTIDYTEKYFPGIFFSPELIRDFQPKWVMGLDNYFGFVSKENQFINTYNVFWLQTASSGRVIQPYWIYRRGSE
jgi:hypothetical protein